MKRFFILVFLFVSLSCYAQIPSGPLTLKGGHPVLDGEILKTPDTIIQVLGKDVYQNSWKKAASLRRTGLGLTIAGSVVFGYGLAGFITGTCVDWPDSALEPERYDAISKAYTVTKVLCAGGVAMLGAGIPLFCVGKGRLKSICDQYNLTVSTAPGSLALTLRF